MAPSRRRGTRSSQSAQPVLPPLPLPSTSTSTRKSRRRGGGGAPDDSPPPEPSQGAEDLFGAGNGSGSGTSSKALLALQINKYREYVEPGDKLTPLSSELHALILNHLSPPSHPDLKSLANYSLVSRQLLPHVRIHMYRNLKIDTRTNAHAMHRTLHGNDLNKSVKHITADVGSMAKTSSQWLGWFLFHSMHSLCGIIGSCRTLLTLTLYLPADGSAWTQSLCSSLVDLKYLNSLTKDLVKSSKSKGIEGAGSEDGMDVGWRPAKSFAMWSVSQFVKPLATLKSLQTLRLCGISSDSSTSPPQTQHNCKLIEVVLIEVNITNTDLLHLLGHATSLKKLTLWRSSLLSKRGLTHVLKRCPNLTHLRIGGSWFGAKDEDDTNFPIDVSINSLPNLRLLHVSGALVSPQIFLNPVTCLKSLLVVNCQAFSPEATNSALVKMRSEPLSVERLYLPEMESGANNGGPESWNEYWKFTIKATTDAKKILLNPPRKVRQPRGGGAGGASLEELEESSSDEDDDI
ncbi:hypothetical protein T439DRAFT_383518 [Meredithblackwellia eburnea MCA 4105]